MRNIKTSFIKIDSNYSLFDFFSNSQDRFLFIYCHRVLSFSKETEHSLITFISEFGDFKYLTYLDEERNSMFAYIINNSMSLNVLNKIWKYYESMIIFSSDSNEQWINLLEKMERIEKKNNLNIEILNEFYLNTLYSKLDDTLIIYERAQTT